MIAIKTKLEKNYNSIIPEAHALRMEFTGTDLNELELLEVKIIELVNTVAK